MVRPKLHKLRPFEIVMNEAAGETIPWDLDEHLKGCLAAYQLKQSYGAAVFFALEVLWGIARDVGLRAKAGTLDPTQLDEHWILSPTITVPVPWMWIRSVSTAWEKYKTEGGMLGHAFGLEGGGQGKHPEIAAMMQMLDELAICRWIGSQLQASRAAQKKIRIEDLIQEAANKFDRSDVTIRRAWRRFGRRERERMSVGHNFPK
jgi:hypothetical protein